MLKKCAMIFGIVMLAVGVLGFVPGVSVHDHLFGIFHINAAHNVVHLLTGIVAVGVSLASEKASRRFFQIFGFVYGLVAILGMVSGDRPVLGLIANNMADVWLHILIAAGSLALGFLPERTWEKNPVRKAA
jgi:hypothetical protein